MDNSRIEGKSLFNLMCALQRGSQGLESLIITNCTILFGKDVGENMCFELLSEMKNLKDINLYNNNLLEVDLLLILMNHQQLQNLNLGRNFMHKIITNTLI